MHNTWCDVLDQAPYTQPERQEAFANAARTITETIAPTLKIDSMHYTTVGQWAHQLPGDLSWYGFTSTQKHSTNLVVLSPPMAESSSHQKPPPKCFSATKRHGNIGMNSSPPTVKGADWQFSKDLRKAFGHETRLSGIPLLHLDHGGSKWYGTTRQY